MSEADTPRETADTAAEVVAVPGVTAEVLAMTIAVAVKAAMEAMAPVNSSQSVDQISAAVSAAIAATQAGNAEANAQAMKRALKPENDPAPLISVYNPAGDRDSPRPRLKCAFTVFDGIPIDGTTDTVEELELMNALEAGDYWVMKSDNMPMKFQVREMRNELGVLQRINLAFPYRDAADAAGVMPMVVWLREVVRQIEAHRQVA